jgi:predicted MFS family arabinose efflux permease
MVRARWTHALPDARRLHTAYSLESALDELVFVIGPVLATVLATSWFPAAGLLVPIVAALGGGLWFCSLRETEPPVHTGAARARRRSALASWGMLVLALTFVGMGSIFGAIDVSIVAFATEHGHKNLSGAILAVFAMGSGISSLLYGARHWLMALWKRYVVGMLVLALGVSLLHFVNSLAVLPVILFFTGFAIAPTIVNGNGLVQNLAAPGQLTEGLAWVGTSLGVGVSIGSWIAGVQIDAGGAHAGFIVVMGAAALLTLAGMRTIRRGDHREVVMPDGASADNGGGADNTSADEAGAAPPATP